MEDRDDYEDDLHTPRQGTQAQSDHQVSSAMGFAEEASIIEARLERDYQQLKPFNELIHSWDKLSSGHAPFGGSNPGINDELKRASRKVRGFWSRLILLYQNNQLRRDLFAPPSSWLERSKEYRTAAEPLDAQIRLQDPAVLSWSPMNKQSLPLRPHTFRTLEELEKMANRYAGEETLKRFIARRKEALRLCDEEALQKFAASAKEFRNKSLEEGGQELGPSRALSLRERYRSESFGPRKGPRVTTPASQLPYVEQPAHDDSVQGPLTPAQPTIRPPAPQPAAPAVQPPASDAPGPSAAAPAEEGTPQKPSVQVPVNVGAWQPPQAAPAGAEEVPETSADFADITAAPSALIRELTSGDKAPRDPAEDDEAEKALHALAAKLPIKGESAASESAPPAQRAPKREAPSSELPREEGADAEADTPATPGRGNKSRRVRIAEQPELEPDAEAPRAEGDATEQTPVAVPLDFQPQASEAAAGRDQTPADKEGKNVAGSAAVDEAEGSQDAGLQRMQSVKISIGNAGQQLRGDNPFFEIRSDDPDLLEAARQQRSMSLNSTSTDAASQRELHLPENPFFEIRGPASSPEQLLRHATLYLLGGESPSATAADLGIMPLSRANTEPVTGPLVPGAAAPELAPKTPRQAGSPPKDEAPATSALPPATSAPPRAPLAPMPERGAELAEEPQQFDVSGTFVAAQPSTLLKPQAATTSDEDTSSGGPSQVPKASETSEEEPSSGDTSRQTSSGKSSSTGKTSDIYLPAWDASTAKGQTPEKALLAEAVPEVPETARKDRAGTVTPGLASRAPSWQPATPGQSMEVFSKGMLMREGSSSGPPSGASSASHSGSLPDKAAQLAEQLQRGNTINRITAARRLQRLAASKPQAGDAVWEAEGVVPLAAMLDSCDPEQFKAAAAAIAELANPKNRAFQIGIGEAGGVKTLIAAIAEGDEARGALAARALAAVVRGTPALQEMLLDSGGAPFLAGQLDAPEGSQPDEDKGSDIASEDSLSLKRQQSFQLAKPSPVKTSKKGEVAGLIAAFAGGFAPAQKAMVNADGLPKLTHLLTSASLDVQDKALSALLACTAKNAEYQAMMTDAGALPYLADTAKGAAAQPYDPTEAAEMREEKGKSVDAQAEAGEVSKDVDMARKALELLYSLASYFANHAALQAHGCIEVLVAAMASTDAVCAQFAVWAVQSLTAGSSRTEKALCNAGAISGLLDLIRRCQGAPEEAPEPAPARKSRSKSRAPAPPSKQSLLEPAVVALSNLAAESAFVKDDMRQAGAIELCVQLLTAQGSSVPGHAARALWNLTSKNPANQDATREAGAVPHLVAMLKDEPAKGKAKSVSTREEAAGMIGSMTAGNVPNQDAFRAAGALPLLLDLVLTADKSIKEQAAWALNALTDKNGACLDEMTDLEAPVKLLPLLNYPESWNWTPVVSTLQNLSGGSQHAKQALVAADAISVLLDILSFGRPTLQALSAGILGNLGSTGDQEFKQSFKDAGGIEKLQELSKSGSLTPTAVRKAAASALTDITIGRPRPAKKKSKLRHHAISLFNSKRWCLGMPDLPTDEPN